MSADSPAAVLFDEDGNPLATAPGTPAASAVAVQGVPGGEPLALALPTNAAEETGGHLESIDNKIPNAPAEEHVTAVSPHAVRLTDGSAFYKATTPTDTQPVSAAALPLPIGAATSALQSAGNASLTSIDGNIDAALSSRASEATAASILAQLDVALSTRASETTLASVDAALASIDANLDVALSTRASEATLATANGHLAAINTDIDVALSTRASEATLASVLAQLDVALSTRAAASTQTDGTQKSIVRGGAKGATAAADVTSTAEGADHQALDAQVYHGGAAIDPRAIRALTAGDVVTAQQGTSPWVENLSQVGGSAIALGQTTMAASLPVAIASNQTDVGVKQATASNLNAQVQGAVADNAALAGNPVRVGASDGTNLQTPRVFDVDTGAGTQYALGVSLRKAASGGSVEAGTSADPLRTDPTGTTAQPVTDNGGSLTVDTPQLPAALVGGRLDANVGAWLGSTAPTVGNKAQASSIPVTRASEELEVGAHGNAWNATAVGAGGTSTAIDTRYLSQISVFGNTSGATTLTVQFSQDNTNFYDAVSEVVTGGGDFAINGAYGARYLRLKSSQARTITATIAGKN